MSIFRTLLFGGLGFTVGGPIGAIVGVVLSSLIDVGNNWRVIESGDGVNAGRKFTKAQMANDYRMTFLVMFAAVMKADGRIMKTELNVVKKFLVNNYGTDGALEALQILKKLLEQNIDVDAVSHQCAMNMTYSTRLHLIHQLFAIAMADNDLDPKEEEMICHIALEMEVVAADVTSITAMYKPKTDSKAWAMRVLELENGASQDDIKRTYRRMAMKYHPDKVSVLGDEERKKAEDKFKEVKKAYEILKI